MNDCKYPRVRLGLLVLSFFLGATAFGAAASPSAAGSGCQRHFRAVEYCTADDGQTHIVTIDLTDADVSFDVATASGATGPNPPSWTASMRQTVAQMAKAQPTLDGVPLAVAINGDYGASDGTHGWEGFVVQRGVRLEGPTVDSPDCDCTAFDRSCLTLSQSKPTHAEIARRTPEELDQYDAYQSNCAGSQPFAGCQVAVLNRTPGDDEAARLQQALKDRWYTAVAGGPAIVQDGQRISISQACQEEKFQGDWCADVPKATPERMRQLRMGTVAGITADGKHLILIVTTARLPNELTQLLAEQGAYTGIRFDGSESSQLVYNGEEKTGNTRRISNALLVYANPLAADDASLAEPAWPVVALPEDSIEVTLSLRNDGTATWTDASGYALANVKNPLGAPESLRLPRDVPPGETAMWTLKMTAPKTPGVHRSVWELRHDDVPFGERATVWVGVLPDKAKQWKAELDRLIEDAKQKWEEAKQRGEREFEQLVQELIEDLERRLAEIVEKEAKSCCAGLLPAMTLMLLGVGWSRRRK